MTEAEQVPAGKFPRLYRPDLAGQAIEPFPLPERDSAPPSNLRIATGAFDPQFLVMLHGTDSDLPLGLFADRSEAVEFAREVRANPAAHAEQFVQRFDSFALVPPTRWLSVSVLEYAGPIPSTRTQLFDLS